MTIGVQVPVITPLPKSEMAANVINLQQKKEELQVQITDERNGNIVFDNELTQLIKSQDSLAKQ